MSQASYENVFKTAALNHSATLPLESPYAITIENHLIFWRRWFRKRGQSSRTNELHKQLLTEQSVTKMCDTFPAVPVCSFTAHEAAQ